MTGDIHALAGAYALNAVDDVERAAFDRHLTDCAACRLEVAELRETACRLADDTAVGGAATAALRDRVLAEVARTPQERAGAAAPRGPGRRDWRRWSVAAAAAAVLALASAGGTWAVLQERLARERAASAHARQVAAVVEAPDARVESRSLPGGGAVLLVMSPRHDRAVVLARGLPAPGAGRTYQVWLVRGAEPPQSAGVMGAGATEGTMLLGPMTDVTAIGLSNEPGDGSPSPTGSVLSLRLA
ncbi:MAG TPA: anti-sigma factor [Pilimelia sp.]|nr:anti-sigma factor [Pilimelia sp.]